MIVVALILPCLLSLTPPPPPSLPLLFVESPPFFQCLVAAGFDAYNVTGGLEKYQKDVDQHFPLY